MGEKDVSLAPVEPVVDIVPPVVVKDPLAVPLHDKKSLLDQYAETVWRVPGVTTSSVRYGDSRRNRIFATSEGTYIEQGQVDVSMHLSAAARDGGEVQQSSLSLGSNGDYSFVETLHGDAEAMAHRAVDLVKAPQVKGGEYTVVLDPVLAGVFIHEAFGHLSEADHVYENQQLRDIMVMGRRFGGPHINVVDGAAVPGLRGSYKYDSEGVPSTKTYLLREGGLVGRLHSRETAAAMGEVPTGNARAISSQFPPIVRMTNTYIEPGDSTFGGDDLRHQGRAVRPELVRRHDDHGAVHFLRGEVLRHPKRQGGGAHATGAFVPATCLPLWRTWTPSPTTWT